MTRKITSVAILSLLLLAFLGTAVFAAKEAPARRVIDPTIYKVMQYSFPYPDETQGVVTGQTRVAPRQELGSAAPGAASPGVAIGTTWYDYQHNGSMGRMIQTGTNSSTVVHFSWMFMPSSVFADRQAMYDAYDIPAMAFGNQDSPLPSDFYAGYVNLDVTNTNRALVGGHAKQAPVNKNAPFVGWDAAENSSYFGTVAMVPYDLMQYEAQIDSQEVIWPKFQYVEGPGVNDTVLHVFAQASLPNAGDAQAIYYFRRVGGDDNPGAAWDDPPFIVDTVFDIAQVVEATDDGKVALVWTANIPCTDADPATASCNDGSVDYGQWNNDIYYMISNDYGQTWQPRVNLTNSRDLPLPHYQPYTDAGILIDSDGDLHITWSGAYWDVDGIPYYRNRIFHWSEDVPYIRTAHSADFDQTTCNGGAWQTNAAKMTISECNGKFYLLFTQFNDARAGILNDCAIDENPGYPTGSANGELYVCVSDDNGLTWDAARNLTNSRTPGCNAPATTEGPCESDHWSSMSRFGTNVALDPTDDVTTVVVPAGGANTGWFLDVQYINDHSAGGIVQDEGTWQQSDVRWFRLACVDAIKAPNPVWSPVAVDFPAWTKAGSTYTEDITIENLGNLNYTYGVSEIENASTPAGITNWLSYAGFSGTVNYGLSNTETGTMTITPTGAVAGTIYHLTGGLVFTGNNPTSPDTIPIDFIVADTVYPPELDTVMTTCLSLVMANNGELGDQGSAKVNMDYYDAGDCDTTAQVYLYSGSPVVAWIDGIDTVGQWSAFGNSYLSPVGFFPISNSEKYDTVNCEAYKAQFVTRDTSLMLEKTIFAHKTATDSCSIVIQRLRIWSADGAVHTGLAIGEAYDWDIPADSGSDNSTGLDATKNYIWQIGGEYDQDATECQDNDLRYGGVYYFYGRKDDTTKIPNPVNAYTADNATYVYNNEHGFVPAEIYTQMVTKTGYTPYDPDDHDPDSAQTDLHMVLTYGANMTIDNVNDTLLVWTALITGRNSGTRTFAQEAARAREIWEKLTPCALRGDVNCDASVKVNDLTALVNFLFKSGAPACKTAHADVNADKNVKVNDLTALVNFLFKSGAPPKGC